MTDKKLKNNFRRQTRRLIELETKREDLIADGGTKSELSRVNDLIQVQVLRVAESRDTLAFYL